MLSTLSACTELQVGNSLWISSIATTAVDWGQTRSIVRHPGEYREINPILGEHPSFAQVDRYFPVILAGELLSYPLVKPAARPYLYGAITLLESVIIAGNFRNGLHLDFVAVQF
jgi:hypothetical protein